MYTAELAPSKLRGLFVGMNGVCIGTGYSIASYMGLAFYSQTDPTTQWRGPLGLALIFPCIMLIVIMIVPESPRWLCMVNRTEEACKIVMKLHGVQGHPDQEYARAEFYQMQKQAEFDKTLEPSWKELFLRPSYRRRMIIGCGFAIVGQSTAILVVNNYGPMLYEALGYGVRDRLILQCGWSTVAIPLNMVGKSQLLDLTCSKARLIGLHRTRSRLHGPLWSQTVDGLGCGGLLRYSHHRNGDDRCLRITNPVKP